MALTTIALMQSGPDALIRARGDRVQARNLFERTITFALTDRPWIHVAWREAEDLVDAFMN